MPELSRFEGMVIKMLFNDTVQHNKPHVHVTYGEYKASVGIDGELLAGSLPQKQFRMLVGWLALHEEEAYAAWNKAVRGEHFDKIKPLRKEVSVCFILNGIVYASERPENIEITQATPLEDMMMILTFSTGEQRLFDATVLTGPAFQPLADTKVFNSCKVVNGVVTWMDEEIDCAPEFMYEHSFPYDREKEAV